MRALLTFLLMALAFSTRGAGVRMPDWSPLCIPGCQVYYTSDGRVEGTSTTNVSLVYDYSGNGHTATQSTSANMPGHGAPNSFSHGHGVVNFNGTTHWLNMNAFNGHLISVDKSNFTLVILGNSTNNGAFMNRVFSTTATTNAGFLGAYAPYSDAVIYFETANQTAGQGRMSIGSQGGVPNSMLAFGFMHSNATSVIYTNAVALGSGSTPTQVAATNCPMYIGAFGPGTQDFWHGQFLLFVDYNRVLTPAELKTISRWAANKAGLVVP